jgi:serine/threonine protein kinase
MSNKSNDKNILSEYETKGQLGKGTFSVVKLGIKKSTKEKVAIKILEKRKIINKDDLQRVEREINILKHFNNLNVIKIYDILENSEKHFL